MYKNGMRFNKLQQEARQKIAHLEKGKYAPPPTASASMPVRYGTTPDQDKMRFALSVLGAGRPYQGAPMTPQE